MVWRLHASLKNSNSEDIQELIIGLSTQNNVKVISLDKLVEEFKKEELIPIQQVDGKEDFAGAIRYEVTFDIENITDKTYIELSGVMESGRVYVNYSACGVKICPPYKFSIKETLLRRL